MNIVEKRLNELKPYENNPRINDGAVKFVKNSIEEFGFKVPIVIDKNGVIVAGHTRYKASQELFKGADNWNVKFSIITLDEEDARKIEVGVPSPRKRLEAMKKYTELSKGGATLRLRPFIVGVSDKTYLDLIREAKKAGATAVTTEFFCLEMRSIKQAKEHYDVISECAGFDIVDFYRKHSNGSGYLRLNRKVKAKYIQKMKELCDELGMRFYVSDAHFKECSNNCCCCALDKNWDYSRGNFSGALQIAKKHGRVHWKDIENNDIIYEYDNSVTFLKRTEEITELETEEARHV